MGGYGHLGVILPELLHPVDFELGQLFLHLTFQIDPRFAPLSFGCQGRRQSNGHE
jgi:hypothetical protein